MTRNLFVLAVLLLLLIIVSVVVGLVGNASSFLILGLMCASPLFMLTLGAAFGRASNEFAITRRADHPRIVDGKQINPRIQRLEQGREHLS